MPKFNRNKIKKNRKSFYNAKSTKIIFIILAGIAALFFFLSGPRGTIQLYQNINKKENLVREIERLEHKKVHLDSLKNELNNNPEYIEKIAREKYNMKKKGEKVLKVVKKPK